MMLPKLLCLPVQSVLIVGLVFFPHVTRTNKLIIWLR